MPDLAQATKLIIDSTNAFRKEEGRSPVTVNAKLTETARSFADFIARTNKYGHNADGNRPADRAKKHGYDYCIVLENIAYQYNSRGFTTQELARGFFEGWKNSPGHRRNMLDPDVTETGVAITHSEKSGYYYAVQMFGRPKSLAIEFRLSNQADAPIEYKIASQSFTLQPNYIRTHTRCRPEEVTIQLPGETEGAKGQTRTIRPRNGDLFVLTGKNGTYEVKKASE